MDSMIYLVRFGALSHIGRFQAHGGSHDRGQTVVIQSRRGTELGEVLNRVSAAQPAPVETLSSLRPALSDDLERAHRARADRARRLQICEEALQSGPWPLTLIDVEPLLDEARTVLYYLGPRGLDTAELHGHLRDRHGLDPVFEPIGKEADNDPLTALDGDLACASKGCGVKRRDRSAPGSRNACDGCSLRQFASARP